MITSTSQRAYQGVAFLGNYVPRICGIATFTHDLAESVAGVAGPDQPVIVAAMNDRLEGYKYPDRVKFEIRQDYQIDYARAADFLNFSRIDVVCLQHEYGIFGGEWGSNVLSLLRDLHAPLVVTCHTILKKIEPVQKEVFSEIVAKATKLVVMSDLAVDMLQDIYKAPREKIVHIPHGIHDVPFIDPAFFKDKFGVEGRNLLLTFGLLHINKGIEYMIEALPAIVERHPKTTYLILGATHPAVIRQDGEAYRLSLQRRIRELGLEENVLFHPRFVETDELLEYLGAADICVTPYLNMEQITSGALSYAMGSGKAIVSTPYWHAEELLAEGRGRLVPLRDSASLAREINGLLDDEVLLSSVRKKAYLHTRGMVWSSVARNYLQLFEEVRSHSPRTHPTASSLSRPLSASNLPHPRTEHLVRLCDDTGPSHHARYTVPDWRHGYRLEDAAAVLVASAKFDNQFGDAEATGIARTCLALINTLVGDGRHVAEGLDYARSRMGNAGEAATGKALWALGYVVTRVPSRVAEAANDVFQELMAHTDVSSIRGQGYSILGAANYLERFPGASDVRRFLVKHTRALSEACKQPEWMERWGGADWPVAAQALTEAAKVQEDDGLREQSRRLIAELREQTQDGTLFLRRGENPDEEELPTTAAAFIEAIGALYDTERKSELLEPMRQAVDWFLGVNRKGIPLYDFSTGGCRDALTAAGANRNQGTEATAFCLIAMLTLSGIATIDSLPTAVTRD